MTKRRRGRPRSTDLRVCVYVQLPLLLVLQIDRAARDMRVSRAEVVTQILRGVMDKVLELAPVGIGLCFQRGRSAY
jgi:hypothetical protein